jgi:MFS family permease
VLVFLTLFLGVQIGPLFDTYGPRNLLICGSLANFTCYILLAQCTDYWHFMLCLGILGGVSSAVITTVSISVLSHWFYRRRALASGICMAGSSAGGAIIPLLLRTLFRKYDWLWAMRIIAFMALGCYALGVFLVKGRLPCSTKSRVTIDIRALASPRLCFLAVAVFAFEFIIFGCAALLPTYVRYAGFSEDIQFYSLTLLNGMSLFGRVLPGFAADQVGRFNILLSMVCLTLIIMAGVWLPCGSHDQATLYVVVAIFGFGSGGWLSLAPVCVSFPDYLQYSLLHTFLNPILRFLTIWSGISDADSLFRQDSCAKRKIMADSMELFTVSPRLEFSSRCLLEANCFNQRLPGFSLDSTLLFCLLG